jgi:hypothetical protein
MRRITITYNIDPLDPSETREYIRHRLKTAGAGYEIFSTAAMEEVYAFSNGFPRQINIICDLAMFFASQVSQRIINRNIVSQCRERISFPVNQTTAETRDNIRAPAPSTRYRPARKRRWTRFFPAWAMRLVAFLVFVALLVLFTPQRCKNSVDRWVRHTYEIYFSSVDRSAADGSPPAAAAEHGHFAASGESQPLLPVDLPLRVPRPPSDILLPQPGQPETSIPRASPAAAMASAPEAAATESDSSQPEDAIDWLLEKRRREGAQ